MKSILPLLTCISALSLTLTGCSDLHFFSRCPSCEEHDSDVNVSFDWSKSPGAAPEGMSVLFYPVDEEPFWRFELPLDGGNISLPEGVYNVVTYNNDTSSILFENQDSYAKSLVTSRAAKISDALSDDSGGSDPPRNPDDVNQPVMSQPDHVWADRHTLFDTSGSVKTVALTPVRITANYTVTVSNVVNAVSAYRCAVAISGLSAGRFLSDMQLVPYEVTIPGSLDRASTDSFSGTLTGFGRMPGRGKCRLILYFLLRNGEKKAFEYDVTSIVENASDPMNVHIDVEGISLPVISTSVPDTGLDVGTDEWEVVDIELSN